MSFDADSLFGEIKKLQKQFDILRSQSRTDFSSGGGGSNGGYGVGGSTVTTPSVHATFALNPVVHRLDEASASPFALTGSITLRGASVIVEEGTNNASSTLEFHTINGTLNDGQILTMKPKEGKTLTLKTGGNIDITSDQTVTDKEFVILQFFLDNELSGSNPPTGTYSLLSGGGSVSVWVDTATSPLNMDGNSIFFDLKVDNKMSILYNGSNLNYTVDVNGGAHNFFVDDLSSAKLGITETKLESNIPLDMNLNYVEFQEISTPSPTPANDHGFIYAKDVSGVTTPMWSNSGGETSLLSPTNIAWSNITIDVNKDMNQKQLTNLGSVVSTSSITGTSFIFDTVSGTEPKITASTNSSVMGFWVDGFESASVTYDTFGGNKDGEIAINGSSAIGARFKMYNSATPSGGSTTAGRMYFDAIKDGGGGGSETFAMIEAGATNYNSGSEQGEIDFQVRRGGSNTESVAIINQTGFHPPINNSQNYNLGSSSTPWNVVYGNTLHSTQTDNPAFIELYRDNTNLGNNEMGRIVWYGDRTGVNKDSLAWIRTKILDYTQGDTYMGLDIAVNGSQDSFIELYGDDPKIRLHKPADLVRQSVPSNPSSNATGKLFYNSSDNHLSFRKRNDANNAFETVDLEGSGSSGADQDLNNLTDPTSVNQHLIPSSDNSKDLGASGTQWRNLYIDGTAYIDTLSLSGGSNGYVLSTNGSGTLSWVAQSGGGSWVGSAGSTLDMNTYNIEDVDQLVFSTGTSSSDVLPNTSYGIEADGGTSPIGMRYNVPSSKEHNFYINGTLEMEINNGGVNFQNNDLEGVDDIEFTTSNQKISSGSNSIDVNVDLNDWISLQVNTTEIIRATGSYLYVYKPLYLEDQITYRANKIYFNGTSGGTGKYIGNGSTANDFRINVPNDGNIEFMENFNKFLVMDGGENKNIFHREIAMDGGRLFRAYDSTECGYHVTNATDLGTKGTMGAPYASASGALSDSTLNTYFGSTNGCIGVQYDSSNGYGYFWIKANGDWKKSYFT